MKTIDLFLIVCALCFSSCSKEDNSNSALYFKSVHPQVATRSSNTEEESKYDTLIWCTGNDIIWYNGTTGQLNVSKPHQSITDKLIVFLDDKELFSLEVSNPISSIATDFPCINWDPGEQFVHFYKGVPFLGEPGEPHYHDSDCKWEYVVYDNPGYYISKGYPRWENPKWRNIYPDLNWDWDSLDAARDENWKAIEPEWNLFIEQLKKEGKYRE